MFLFSIFKYLPPRTTETKVKMRGETVAPNNSFEKRPLAIREIEFMKKNTTIPMNIILKYFGRYLELSVVTR